MKYDYFIYRVEGSISSTASETLSKYGNEGWRVVYCVVLGSSIIWTLERPVRSAPLKMPLPASHRSDW